MIKNLPDNGNNKGNSYPRSIVRIDGYETYFDEWSVDLNDTHQADSFSVNLPFLIDTDLPQSYLTQSPENQSLLFTKDRILVEIFVGHPDDPEHYTIDNLTRIMYGNIDSSELDLGGDGEYVVISGRNMAAPFLDNKTTVKWQNMTSSAIARMLAAEHGLNAQVTETYALAGTYYNGDNVQTTKEITEWDLLTFLADQEGFVVRVKDNTLYFGPFASVIGNVTTDPVNYTWGQNIETLNITRSPHAAKNIVIEVHSYQAHGTPRHIKATAKSTHAGSDTTYTERYYFAGITLDEAQQRAESILSQFSRMELTGTMQASGDERLQIDHQLVMAGLGYGLDQNYFIQHVSHHFVAKDSPDYTVQVDFSNLLLQDEATGGV